MFKILMLHITTIENVERFIELLIANNDIVVNATIVDLNDELLYTFKLEIDERMYKRYKLINKPLHITIVWKLGHNVIPINEFGDF